jgi:hypothetical protein
MRCGPLNFNFITVSRRRKKIPCLWLWLAWIMCRKHWGIFITVFWQVVNEWFLALELIGMVTTKILYHFATEPRRFLLYSLIMYVESHILWPVSCFGTICLSVFLLRSWRLFVLVHLCFTERHCTVPFVQWLIFVWQCAQVPHCTALLVYSDTQLNYFVLALR